MELDKLKLNDPFFMFYVNNDGFAVDYETRGKLEEVNEKKDYVGNKLSLTKNYA